MNEISRIVGSIRAALTKGIIGPGEAADLRRLNPESPDCPAFWHAMTTWIAPEKRLSPEQETRWAIILSGMVRMTAYLNAEGMSPGRALAEAGFNEGRLTRLLRTIDIGSLAVQIRRISGFLSSKGIPVNWIDFAYFILTTDSDKREERNRRVARDYYYTLNKKEKTK